MRAELRSAIAVEIAVQNKLVAKLEQQVSELQRITENQVAYLSELTAAGLPQMLARYPQSLENEPNRVVAALADIINGMEPSNASTKHGISADLLVDWAHQLRVREPAGGESSESADSSANSSNDYSRLLEEQLIYNAKQARDRESVLRLECVRLQRELELAKSAMLAN